MRHGKKVNHLGRKKGHRAALLRNLSIALIEHKRIFTTLAKGKALRKHVEPIITKAKTNSTHSRRVIFGYLQNKEAVKELFDVIAPRIADRPGGYVRVIKTGFRQGDNADMCMIELVDFNETMLNASDEDTGKKKTRRRRRRSKSSEDATVDNQETITEEEATEE
jgi:large subunit ribosomal protein L17